MLNKPSLESLINRAKTTLINKTGVSNPAIEALASAIAGASYGQYAYQDYLFNQLNPETADEDWLHLWSTRYKVERIAPVSAIGTINFTLTAGVVNVPAGIIVQTADGIEYQTTESVNSDQLISVVAINSGTASNIPAGVNLSLTTAVPGLNPTAITSNEIAGGAEQEDLEHWRNRIIEAMSENQAVGKLIDYQVWATASHADIDYAWAFDNTPQLGHVTVYIGQRQNNPIVSNAIKQICQDYINQNRLAGCHVHVLTPQPKPLNLIIAGVAEQEERNQIIIALQNLINEKLGVRQIITQAELITAISAVTTSFNLTMPIVTLNEDEIITLGNVTWQ